MLKFLEMHTITHSEESSGPDQPRLVVPPYDQAIIADNFEPRIKQVAGYLSEEGLVQGSIDVLSVDRSNPNVHRKYFNDRVREVFAAGQNLLVVNNFFVAARNGYLADLLRLEEEFDTDSKRLLISCFVKDRQRIRAALREYADLVDLVEFDKDNGGADLGQLERAMQSETIRRPRVGNTSSDSEFFSLSVAV